MERQKYNKLILEILFKLVDQYPDLRFEQLLINSGLISISEYPAGESNRGKLVYIIDDLYNEESIVTYKKCW